MRRLSIIIPCHNEEIFLPELLSSISNHAKEFCDSIEIIVVDNCSTDQTTYIAKSFQKVRNFEISVVFEPVMGVSRAKNSGAKIAKGEFLLFLDADIVVSKDFFGEVFSLINKRNFGAATIRLLAEPTAKDFRGNAVFWVLELFKIINRRPFGKSLIRRDLFMECGGFNTSIKLGENGDLLERIQGVCLSKTLSFKHIYSPIYCSLRRFHKEGYFKTLKDWWEAYHGRIDKEYRTISELDLESKELGVRPKLEVFFLGFDEKDTRESLNKLNSLLKGPLQVFEPNIQIIDNSLTQCLHSLYPGQTRVGDNRANDFSGWEIAWKDFLTQHPISNDLWILLVNDSFHKNYGDDYLRNLTSEMVKHSILNRHIIGYVDDFPKSARILNLEYDSWIRSNFVLAPFSLLGKIENLVFPSDLPIFSDDSHFWSQTDILSQNFKAYISSWLFGIEDQNFPEYRLRWYKAAPLTEENRDFFQRKAISILSEHYLSARLLHLGARISNLNLALNSYPNRHTENYYSQQRKHKSVEVKT